MTTTLPLALFKTTSYWDQGQDTNDPALPVSKLSESPDEKIRRLLEDWSLRIQSCADEAGDQDLLALESDLLDLRDEITYTLHQKLLS